MKKTIRSDKRPRALAFLLAVLTTSCIFSRQSGSAWLQPDHPPLEASTWLLGTITDGGGEDGIIVGSGELLRAKIRTELLRRNITVTSGFHPDVRQLLQEAQSQRIRFVLAGKATVWEDNATEWSGNRDQAGVSLELYEAATGTLVAVVHEARHFFHSQQQSC